MITIQEPAIAEFREILAIKEETKTRKSSFFSEP